MDRIRQALIHYLQARAVQTEHSHLPSLEHLTSDSEIKRGDIILEVPDQSGSYIDHWEIKAYQLSQETHYFYGGQEIKLPPNRYFTESQQGRKTKFNGALVVEFRDRQEYMISPTGKFRYSSFGAGPYLHNTRDMGKRKLKSGRFFRVNPKDDGCTKSLLRLVLGFPTQRDLDGYRRRYLDK